MSLRRRIVLLSALLLLAQTLLAWHLPAHLQEQLAEHGTSFGITFDADDCSLSGHGAALPLLAPPAALPPAVVCPPSGTVLASAAAAVLIPPARGPPRYT